QVVGSEHESVAYCVDQSRQRTPRRTGWQLGRPGHRPERDARRRHEDALDVYRDRERFVPLARRSPLPECNDVDTRRRVSREAEEIMSNAAAETKRETIDQRILREGYGP